MPPDTLPWERERSKERRHDRPPPYERPPTPFVGSRGRLPGNGRQGPWRYHSAEPDRGYSPSRVSDKFMGDEGLRPSGYRVESRYNRFNRENSDAYAQRDMRGNNWENGMSPNNLGRPHFGSDRRSIDDRFSSRQKDTKGHFWENGRMQNGSGQRSVEDKGSFGRRDHRGKSRENELFEKRDPCLVDDKQPFEKKGLKRRYQEYGTLPYSSGRPHSLNDHRPLDERRSSGEKLRGKSCENGVFPNRSSRIDSVSDQRSMDDEDSKGQSLENVVAPNISGRIRSVGEQSPVDDMLLTSPTDPYLARTQEKHSKDHYDKYSGAIDVVTSPKIEKEKALGSSDWTHLKRNRSGSLSSRGSELKSDVQPRMDTPLQSPPGDVGGARETTSVASSEEAGSRKKPRLGWGEGLAKFEKKKVEGPIDDSATKPGLVARISGEPSNVSNLTGKSPRVASFLECASPATPYSTACSSSPGIEDKTCIRSAANLDCEFSYLSGSPNLPPREKTDGDQQKEICLGNVELTSIDNISSSLTELIQLEDRTVVESSLDSLSAMEKLFVLKDETLKALEATEAEIDLLEDGLRKLNSESVGVEKTKFIQPHGEMKCTAPLNSVNAKSSEDQILASNKETAEESIEIFNRLLPSSICSAHSLRAKKAARQNVDVRILDQLAFKKRRKVLEDRINALKYRVINHIWKKGLERTNVKKDDPKSKKRLVSNLQRPQGSNQKHRSRARLSNAGNSTLEPSPETIRFATKLLSDSQPKVYRDSLKMPVLMNIKERMASRFISTNGLVEDPCAMEKERALINPWTKEEKYIFMDKLAVFGKNFSKISNFLDHKTTADCVEFYYKNHKSDDFVKLKKKKPDVSMQRKSYSFKNYLVGSGKIYGRENNAASLHVLGEACQEMQCSKAPQIDRNVEKSRSRELDVSINERENEAANVLVGICDSVPSLDHGGSNMRMTDRRVGGNDETCSDNDSRGDTDSSDWNDEERISFIQALKSCGKDFAKISSHVVTRSRVQCKSFFSKTKRRLGPDIILSGPCEESRDDSNDGGNDNEGTCRVQADPVVSGEKAPLEGDKDVIPPRPCDEDKNDNKGRGIDENMVVEASGEDNNDGGNDNEGACRVEAYPVVSGEKAPLEVDKDVIPPRPCDEDKDDNSGRVDENMVVEASGEDNNDGNDNDNDVTTSRVQCKSFFSKTKRRLGPDIILSGPCEESRDDNNDGGNDNEGTCRVQADPVVSGEKAPLEGDKDVIPSRPCDEDKDDNKGRGIDENMVVEASGEDNNDGGNDNEGACRVEAYPVVSGEKAPLEGDKDVIPPRPCDEDKDDNSGRVDENMVVEASGEDNNDGGNDNEGACRVEAYPVVSGEKAPLEGDKDVIPPRPCDEDKDANSGRGIDVNMVVEALGEDIEVNTGVEQTGIYIAENMAAEASAEDIDAVQGGLDDDDAKMEEMAAEDSCKAASESAAASDPPRILLDLNPRLEEEDIPVEEPKRILLDLNPPFEEAAFITPLEEQSHKDSVSGDATRPISDKNYLQRCSAKKKGGDIKLFGKILRSQAEGGSVDASSTSSDDGGNHNHYVAVGNNPGASYGLWNANVIPAEYVHGSTDSALLLAKLPHNITGQQQQLQQQRMVVLNGLPHDITSQQQQRRVVLNGLPHDITGQQQQPQRPVVLNGLPHDITGQQQQQQRRAVLNGLPHNITGQQQQRRAVLNRLPQRGELQAIRKRQETVMQEHRQMISEALMHNGRIGPFSSLRNPVGSGLGVSDPVAAMQRHFAAVDKDMQN